LVSKWPDGTMSLVGGRVAIGESTQAAVGREVIEETGLEVKSSQCTCDNRKFFHF
jgi:8-oxo-dGTP diphosphatase